MQFQLRAQTYMALLLGALCMGSCQSPLHDEAPNAPGSDAAPGWIQLFNGHDLNDWKVKINHHPLGENFADTFRVQDGLLCIDYQSYENFEGQFGHLFYKTPYSNYRLRVEYRFLGEQLTGGPGWALRNSGIMLHCQAPESMGLDQEFPVSIEVQMLGGNGSSKRPTGNLCTPGTHVVMQDQLIKRHCTDSTSKTYHGDQWVTLEVEVRGNRVIRHIMDGQVVLEYSAPQLDEGDANAQALIAAGASIALEGGYISLQSESHPLEFRKVELLPLD